MSRRIAARTRTRPVASGRQIAEVAALGDALAQHAGEVLERVCAHPEAREMATSARSALARVCVLTTVALARWIAGAPAENSLMELREATELLEELATRGSVSLVEVELRCEHLSDAILSVLGERATAAGASPAALDKASSLARTSLAVTLERARGAFAHAGAGAAAMPSGGRDPRTHLPGRELIADRANQLLARAKRDGTVVVALLIDLEFTASGDLGVCGTTALTLVRSIASRLDEVVRGGDSLGHLPGERFVIIAADPSPADALTAIAERVDAALERPFELDGEGGRPVTVAVRANLSYAGADAGDADALLASAAAALKGAPGACGFSPSIDT